MEFKNISKNMSVSSQLLVEDMAELKKQGFEVVINNRPDNEDTGQPLSEELEKAAWEAGMEYYHLPVDSNGILKEVLDKSNEIINSDKKIIGFCRGGIRSATMWAISQKGKKSIDEIINSALDVGYDLRHLKIFLEA